MELETDKLRILRDIGETRPVSEEEANWAVREGYAAQAEDGDIDLTAIIQACATLLKPGGRLFLSTLNRTPAAFALAVVGAEYVARLLPRGTHRYQDFIKPAELAAWLRHADLQLEDVSGMRYEPWRNRATLSSRTEVNYLACAVKP